MPRKGFSPARLSSEQRYAMSARRKIQYFRHFHRAQTMDQYSMLDTSPNIKRLAPGEKTYQNPLYPA
ncbi:hypothetical protein GCM10027180_11150 [Microbulbifer echini]